MRRAQSKTRGEKTENIVLVAEDESSGPPSMQTIGAGGLAQARVGPDRARYDLFFTERRIIAAVIFSTADLSRWGPASQFQGMAAGIRWKKTKEEVRSQFKGKGPDDILRLHPESFQLPYECIQSVGVVKKLIGARLEVEYNAGGRIAKVDIPAPKSRLQEIQNILNMYLPGRVR